MLRVLARYCGSTALALAMHTHQVATAVWRWRRDCEQSGAGQQRRIGLDRGLRVGLAPTGKAPPSHGAHPKRKPCVLVNVPRA
jgi:hypothetical protein